MYIYIYCKSCIQPGQITMIPKTELCQSILVGNSSSKTTIWSDQAAETGQYSLPRSCAFTYGGFVKWWYPTSMGFPTKNDHFGVSWGTTIFGNIHIYTAVVQNEGVKQIRKKRVH